MSLNLLENAKWKSGQNRKMIKLGNQGNHFSIIGIIVKEKEGKTFFLINETPIELEMVNE